MPRNTNTAKAQPSGWPFPGKSVQSLFCFFCETIDSLIQRRFSHNGKTLKEFARCFVQEKFFTLLYISLNQNACRIQFELFHKGTFGEDVCFLVKELPF